MINIIGGRQPINSELIIVPTLQIRRGYWWGSFLLGLASNSIGENIPPTMNWGYFIKYFPIPVVLVNNFVRLPIREIMHGNINISNLYCSGIKDSIGTCLGSRNSLLR